MARGVERDVVALDRDCAVLFERDAGGAATPPLGLA